jgi:hypothetical protein
MLVLAVIAIATLIGIAMLSSASLQAEVGDSAQQAVQADVLAESAVQAAIYYLQYPAKMPASWAGTGNHVMYVRGATLPGSRSITATVQTNIAKPNAAATFGGQASIPPRHTITGNVISNGVPLLGGVLNGTLSQTPSNTDFVVPTAAQINYFGGDIVGGTYLMPDGTVGKPDILSSSTLSSAPTASATNPGKIFYYGGTSLSIINPMNISGTLVVRGTLQIKPASGTVTITSQPGFPALVLDDQLQFPKAGITLQVNGVSWLGNGTAWIGTTPLTSAVFNGAVLMPPGKVFGSTLTGTVTVNFSNANVDLVNLTKQSAMIEPVLNVKVLNWNQ